MQALHGISNFTNVGIFISVLFLIVIILQFFLKCISPVAERLMITLPLGRNKKMASALFIYYSFS